MKYIHNLSKEARQKIIEILLEKRTAKELADELGLTEASISKFRRGKIHPSDETILKTLEVADEEELERVEEIIIDDLLSALNDLMTESKARERVVSKLREMLESQKRTALLPNLV